MSLFVAGAIGDVGDGRHNQFCDAGVSLFVAGAILGDVAVSEVTFRGRGSIW